MVSAGPVLGRAEYTTPFYLDGKQHTLTTRLEVKRARGDRGQLLDTVHWLEARFSLRAAGERRGENVGHVYAYVVDKTQEDTHHNPLWLTEILADKDAEITELRITLGELYDEAGNVRDQVDEWSEDLQDDHILFVDTLMLDESVRGTGLSEVAMQTFHRTLPYISNGRGYTGTIVLSPAASGDYRGSSDKSDAEIEAHLIELYQKVGYDLWVKGDEEEEGSVTVMGLVVAEDDADEDVMDED